MRVPQRRKGERILGPYAYRGRWRVFEVSADGSRTPCYFATEKQAELYKRAAEENINSHDLTTETALEEYVKHLTAEGNKKTSIDRTKWAIKKFWPAALPLWSLNARNCAKRYREMSSELAVDSHRGALAECKTFVNWCVAQRWIPKSPLVEIKGTGKRKKGKEQLRVSESRKWLVKALELAEDGDAGAIAAMLALLLGMRSTEIITRCVRDLDTDEQPGDLLWIPDSKTEAGRRTLEVPEVLRPHLVGLAEAKGRDALLFGNHWRDWPRLQVRRICDLAGVPKVTAHGMRGAHATLALDFGATGRLVASALGHEDERTTRESYASPGAGDSAARKRAQLRLVK